MADEKKKNTIVVLEPSAKSATELLKVVEEKSLAEVVRVESVEEAIQLVAQSLPCIFVASINENQDVPSRVQLFKRLEGAIKQQGLKIFVVTPIKNRQLSDMVTQKLGVADYIVEPVPIRTMQFKINLQIKAVDNFRRQQEIKKAAAEAVVIKKLDNGKKQDTNTGNEVKTNAKPALQAGEDTFLFKNSGVKKAGKKYTVELEGPAPETGEWVPHEDKGDPTPAWRWVPNEEKEKQAKGELPAEGWVHKGDKPLFNDETNKWAMTSEKPSLGLRKKGKLEAEKIGVDEAGEVFVAEDSAVAEENVARNRAKAELLKPKREKKSLKDMAKEDEAKAVPGADAPEAEKEAAAKTARAAAGPKKNQLAGLKNLLGKGGEEEDGASAGELHDQRSGEPDSNVTELRDARGEGEEDDEAVFNGLAKDSGEAAAGEAHARGPLAKLKDEAKRAKVARVKGDGLPEGVNPLEESGESGEPESRALKRNKKNNKISDKLARLAQGLGDGEEEGGEEESEELTEASGEENEDENEESLRGRAAAMLAAEAKRAASLRDDPAAKRGELRDLQANGAKRKESLRDERKKAVAEIQALLDGPLEEEMSAEEEEALREELGLKGRPEIKIKDLARRKRLKNAQKLKKRLADLDAELNSDDDKGEALSSGVSRDADPETARKQHDLTAEKLRGIRGAFDNEQTAEELEEERKRLKAKHEAERKKAANKDKAIYVPEAEIQPIGNAWESSGTHYVYLGSTVRYKGFAKLEDLLPLWYFEGDDAPQLLDKTKQWRFLGGRPEQATTVAEIPAPVRDFLIGLRDQLVNSGVIEADPESEESSFADSAKGPRKKSDGTKDKLRAFADELAAEDEESDEAETTGENGRTRGRDEGGDPESDEERSREDDHPESGEEPSPEDDDPESDEDLRGSGREDRPEEARQSKFDRLKAMLGDDAEGDPGGDATDEAEKPEAETGNDAMARLRAKLSGAEDSVTDKLSAQPGLQGEGVQKFLEKRKKKAETESPEENKASPAPVRGPAPGFLGVFVALSDAYANQANPSVSLCRVLGSLEDSFRKCIVYCTTTPDENGMAEVRYHSPGSPAPTEKIALSGGLSEPVQTTAGGQAQVLGYLFMGAVGERTAFNEAEETTFRKMASKIWPLLNHAQKPGNKEAA